MRNTIKKLLRENLLGERLTGIDIDVDMIYNKYFKSVIETIEKTNQLSLSMMERITTSTSVLTSPDSVKCNQMNPCKIIINSGTNYYQPSTSSIGIGFNRNAFIYVIEDCGGNLRNASEEAINIGLLGEFTEEKLKGSIHHELVHWIDDTLNNRHITKKLNRASELGTKDFKGVPSTASKFEIQAQIHNIHQLYKKYHDSWNELSFDDMLNLSSVLKTINNHLKEPFKAKWRREIKTRMNREKLLGAKMI